MRRVKCHECGKRYNFDVDDFCPNCGAFTQPHRTSRIGADGSVIRVDGINESYHQESFVHAELHEENRERRGTPLEMDIRRAVKKNAAPRRPAARPSATRQKKEYSEKERMGMLKIVVWGALILFFLLVDML